MHISVPFNVDVGTGYESLLDGELQKLYKQVMGHINRQLPRLEIRDDRFAFIVFRYKFRERESVVVALALGDNVLVHLCRSDNPHLADWNGKLWCVEGVDHNHVLWKIFEPAMRKWTGL